MDMYRILETLAAVSSKQTLAEGQMKRHLEDLAVQMSRAAFVDNAGEYGMTPEEAAEFWSAVNGEDEELDEERRSEEDWDAQALAQQKAKLAREKNKMDMQRRMQNPEKYAKDNIDEAEVAGQFKNGDRVMYSNTFATVVGQDGDAYIVKVDKQPNTMKVPASAIKKPSYDESMDEAESAKPDFLDLDRDGDKKEPMKKAAREKTDHKSAFQSQFGGSARDLTKGLSVKPKSLDEVFPGTPEYELRFGKDDASSAFDKKKISTGTVYSRRYRDEPEADDDTPRAAGRPKGAKRRLGAKGPGVDSKLLKGKGGLKEQETDTASDAILPLLKKFISIKSDPEDKQDLIKVYRAFEKSTALGMKKLKDQWGTNLDAEFYHYAKKNGLDMNDFDSEVNENIDPADRGEYDREGDMALNQVHQIADAARELHAILASDDNLPEWVQSKITKALDYIDTSRDYLKAKDEQQHKEIPEIAPIAPIAASLGRAAVAGAASGAAQSAMGSNDEVAEKAPPGAKAERMVKHIKSGYAKDGKLSDKEKSIAYATAWKAKKAGKVEEESADKKDVPFDGPYRTKDDDKDQFGNKVKHTAQHAARKGLADMTTAALKAELKRRTQVEEESTDTEDTKAEKAGKRVAKDIEHDEGHEGRDDAKAEKAGKRVTKDIESDDKKDKKKEVEETTVSGSVATAPADGAPKSKGGMQFGKGVYEGQLDELDKSTLGSYVKKASKDVEDKSTDKEWHRNMWAGDYPVRGGKKEVKQKQAAIDKRQAGIGKAVDRLTKEGVYEGQVAESFETKLKNVLNEGMSVNVSTDDNGKKSISVNATDADADALGSMLKMAGLFSSEGYSRTCESCHGIHEAGACRADQVEEDLANSPNEVYADTDYMTQTLSGGLNGPKKQANPNNMGDNPLAMHKLGQKASPSLNLGDVAESVEKETTSRLWNLYKKI
jgi:hypothetical protein